MAQSIVQAIKAENSAGNSCSHAITATAGNLLDIAFTTFRGNTTGYSVSDNGGTPNTYNFIGSLGDSGRNAVVADYYAKNISGGTYTVTFTAPATASEVTVFMHEVSGCDTSAPLDQNGRQNGVTTTSPTTPSITPTVAASIAFATFTNDDGSNPCSFTPGNSFTVYDTTNSQELNGSVYSVGQAPNRVLSSTATINASWTTGTAQNYVASIRNYKAASSGSTSLPPVLRRLRIFPRRRAA